jgi:hypothetical protein
MCAETLEELQKRTRLNAESRNYTAENEEIGSHWGWGEVGWMLLFIAVTKRGTGCRASLSSCFKPGIITGIAPQATIMGAQGSRAIVFAPQL